MKHLISLCSLTLLVYMGAARANPVIYPLPIENKGIEIVYSDEPEFGSSNHTGIKKKKLYGNDLLQNPDNNLALILHYDPEGTANNLSWQVVEWDVSEQVEFDRDPIAEGIQSQIFIGEGRLFLNKRQNPSHINLSKKKVSGVTNLTTGDASLLNPGVAFSGYQGSVSVTGKLDSSSFGQIVQFKGDVIGTAFIGVPAGQHQVTIKIKINAKLKP
ncbi:hypothetical protein [Methylomicrobium sp. Wu6]|uniref:hypothetical protein n=1 Tax=Methylomicrobium sp. Wu6 TaxID=3107928 RepID=UPI002DD6A2A9|nr:hypothetical protein [Methylomicrobium sp. Wu6]MEC4746870.1 hypothetical protein [Methylomicrobium sp. Wu6]